jgi:AcrR family transcriptional regulator
MKCYLRVAKRNLTITRILEHAVERIDAPGRNETTIGELANDLGVQPSALYNHIDGLDGLKQELSVYSTHAVADHLFDSVVATSGADLLPPATLDGSLKTAQQRIVDVFVRVLSSTGLEGDNAVQAARTVRSAIHGFVALESIDAFTSPVDPSTSFEHLVDFLVTGLAAA